MRKTVIFVLFDIPGDTSIQRHQGSRFRKGLIRLGYTMFQKSIYYKLLTNISSVPSEQRALQKIVPDEGEISMLPIPLGHFSKIITLVGTPFDLERLTAPILEFGDIPPL